MTAAAGLATLEVTDPDGNPVVFGELAADPLVVVLVRYFGCLPCQAYLQDLSAQARRFPEGSRVVAVGGSADYQARWLRGQGVAVPLLLDPDQQVRHHVGLGNLRLHQLLAPRGAVNYARAMKRGLRPQAITRDTVRSPGVALLGPDLQVRWAYEGRVLGDYPPVETVLEAARTHGSARG